MTIYTLEYSTESNSSQSEYISSKLFQYNCAMRGNDFSTVNIFIRNSQSDIVGGLLGWHRWGWAHIDCLWIDEIYRKFGFGKMLLETSESEFTKQKCRFCDLDTFSFQAPEFYLKFGYQIIHELDIDDRGTKKIFMKKNLS